jgi:hypothetical protein
MGCKNGLLPQPFFVRIKDDDGDKEGLRWLVLLINFFLHCFVISHTIKIIKKIY